MDFGFLYNRILKGEQIYNFNESLSKSQHRVKLLPKGTIQSLKSDFEVLNRIINADQSQEVTQLGERVRRESSRRE